MQIVLIDRGMQLLDTIINNTNWTIAVLVIEGDIPYSADKKRVQEVYEYRDMLVMHDTRMIDYEEISKYKNIQACADAGYRRYNNDYAMSKLDFYTSISFWEGIFHDNQIDACIIVEPLHGFKCDAVPYYMACDYNIMCYNVYPDLAFAWGIYCANNRTMVKNQEIVKDLNIANNKFYSLKDRDYIYKRQGYLASKLYNIFGYVFCKVMFQLLIRHTLYDCISRRKELVFKYFYYYYKISMLNHYYESLCHDVNYQSPYIVYYLHLEPEAVIQNSAEVMDSQLVAIKMLADSLPDGWRLYVKEHPNQWKLNRAGFAWHLREVLIFRNKYYYQYIDGLAHVELISSIQQDNKKLIKNAKAVATFTGTIALEAADYKKPVFLFASDKGIYQYCNSFFHIHSMKDCHEGIRKILEGYIPDYSDLLDVCNTYLFPWTDEGKAIIIKTIQQDLEKKQGKNEGT